VIKLRRFAPVYRRRTLLGSWEYTMGRQTFATKKEAATLPRGPNVPDGLQVVEVKPITFTLKSR
jgi:hypothetical protein